MKPTDELTDLEEKAGKAKRRPPKHKPGIPPAHHGIDWDLDNITISKQLGVSRERVRQLRVAAGQSGGRVELASKLIAKFLVAHSDEVPYLSAGAFWLRHLKDRGVTLSRFRSVLFETKQSSNFCKSNAFPTHLLNWAIPNVDLAEVWHVSVGFIARHRTTASVVGTYFPPAWDRRDRIGAPELERLNQAIEAEHITAAKFLQLNGSMPSFEAYRAVPTNRPKVPLDQVNWELSNGILASVWKVSPSYFVSRRYSCKRPKPKTGFDSKAVEQEAIKALKWQQG